MIPPLRLEFELSWLVTMLSLGLAVEALRWMRKRKRWMGNEKGQVEDQYREVMIQWVLVRLVLVWALFHPAEFELER